eukprot:GHVU01059703.1.p1 GENE.GHVU01059703.1~~GHVU01059703.1.p1  ORF type:complete len:418 (-),score=35.97 GHVU01059703.1:438-1523(-)
MNNTTKYGNRLVYSDAKVQGATEEGFDRLRAGNAYDIDGGYGDITKLLLARDNLYAIQQKAACYIPTGNRVIEGTDSSLLQIRSGEFINDPKYITTQYGSKHPRATVVGNDKIYFVDTDNKAVLMMSDQGVAVISEKGMISEFRSVLNEGNTNAEKLHATYDPKKKLYILSNENNGSDFCYVWSDLYESWVSEWSYNTSANANKAMVYLKGVGYIIGATTNDAGLDLDLFEMETGAAGNIFGTVADATLTYVVNDKEAIDFVKTFDNMLINVTGASGGRLGTADFITYRDTGLGNQTGAQVDLSTAPREDLHKVKVLRDGSDARLRGTHLETTLTWDNSAYNEKIPVGSVITKYRISPRRD